MAKVLDTTAYLDTVCGLLREGQPHVPVTVAGVSMVPFFAPGDTVYLDLPDGPVRPGDVVLFRRFGKQYVLHRVVRILPDGSLELLGDAQVQPERVDPQQVCARATGLRRGQKHYGEKSLRWRFFRGPWRHIRRLRPYVNRLHDLLRK